MGQSDLQTRGQIEGMGDQRIVGGNWLISPYLRISSVKD